MAVVADGNRKFTVEAAGGWRVSCADPILADVLTDAVVRRMRELSPADGSPIYCAAEVVAGIVNGKVIEVDDFDYPPETVF